MNQSPSLEFKFDGDGTKLFVEMLKNGLLTMVTLGIYGPWAYTNLRKFYWQHTSLSGQKFEYHGTGKETLIMAFKFGLAAMVAFGVAILPGLVKIADPTALAVLSALFGITATFALTAYISHVMANYTLSRTTLGKFHFGLTRSFKEYFKVFFVQSFLSYITGGIYAPWAACEIQRKLMSDCRMGSASFSFEGQGTELFKHMFFGALLTVVTLGIYAPWFYARVTNFYVNNTKLHGVAFEANLQGGDVFKHFLLQGLLLFITSGIYAPWAIVSTLSFHAERIKLGGGIDFASIKPTVEAGPAQGAPLKIAA